MTLLPNFGGFHRTLQRERLANRGRLLLRTPGPVPVGTCICSNVETILSWTCHVYGPFEFWTSLGTYILLFPVESRDSIYSASHEYPRGQLEEMRNRFSLECWKQIPRKLRKCCRLVTVASWCYHLHKLVYFWIRVLLRKMWLFVT